MVPVEWTDATTPAGDPPHLSAGNVLSVETPHLLRLRMIVDGLLHRLQTKEQPHAVETAVDEGLETPCLLLGKSRRRGTHRRSRPARDDDCASNGRAEG